MKNNHFFLLGILLSSFISSSLYSQKKKEAKGYLFTNEINLESTDIKSQDITGTCWSFSTISFIESELIRMGKGSFDLSEMYNVRMTYELKADNYVRRHGKAQFGEGSLNHDVMKSVLLHGLVPESEFSAQKDDQGRYNHIEVSRMLKSMLETTIKNPNKKLSPAWKASISSTLDNYIGEKVESFEYESKTYTPQSFAEFLEIDPSNYVSITSFLHHPYYQKFILEVPDNWSNGIYENVQLNELIETIDYALENGFTLSWDADVSEKTWSSKKGIAIIPEKPYNMMDKSAKKDLFEKILPEMEITPEIRQKSFDNYETTDDHLMHIIGIGKDQNGNKYYLVKNSWGTKRGIDGYYYISEAYMKMKTIGIMLHKDGIPMDIKKKLKL